MRNVPRTIDPMRLSRVLREAGYDVAADAAAATSGEVSLEPEVTKGLRHIFVVRLRHMEERGWTRGATDVRRLLEVLDGHRDPEVLVAEVSDSDHHHLCFLTADAVRVLVVVVPPRSPRTPAPPIGEDGIPLWPDPLDA